MGEKNDGKQYLFYLLSFLGTIWGLPFDMMTEKIGKEIGSNLGVFMVVDTRSWMLEQAKFMRIKVNLPLEKTLKKVWKSS